jgi:RimJ/RimL family protein N-acetyltransferase
VLLRELEPGDIDVFFANQADADSNRLAAVPSRGRADYEAHMSKLLADPEVVVRTVVDDDGTVAGQVLSFPRRGVRELGYWLGRQYWGRGIATAAVRAFLQLMPERPLYAVVAEHNPASRRVLERNGFALVDRQEADPLVPDGPPVPVLVLRLD